MSAVETGQMSAAETGQTSSVARPDTCLVSTHDVEVSEVSTVTMSQCSSLRSLNCGNVTMFKSQKPQLCKSQIGGLALNRRKWPEMGPEWSPGGENRSPWISRPFPRLWDRSRGPKPPNYTPSSRSTAPGGRYVTSEFQAAMSDDAANCGFWVHGAGSMPGSTPVSYTHLRAHET